MPRATNEQRKCRKPPNLLKSVSFSQQKPHPTSILSNENLESESRKSFSKKPKRKNKFLFVKLKGLGCNCASLPPSTPAIIRSAAEWEAKGSRNKKQRSKKVSHLRRNQENVVFDVPDVCCTPPGIGIGSDFAPKTRNTAPRSDHRKHSREARRNEDDSRPDFAAILSGGNGSRTNLRSAVEIIEMLMSQQALASGRIFNAHDDHQAWRLNVDDMSYEELVDLSDRIGYVGTGLQEEEIYSCLRILQYYNPDSTFLVTGQKDWKCSICQEKCRRDDDIGTLDCGHHHHLRCIKQWLLHKNACPVCKSAAMPDKSN